MAQFWVIEEIKDTRSYDWVTGKMVPGTGEARPCDHCGKTHEIHVTISRNKETMIVGSTCAKNLVWDSSPLSTKSLLALAQKNLAIEICRAIKSELPDYKTSGLTNLQFNNLVDEAIIKTDRKRLAVHFVRFIFWQYVYYAN